MDSIPNSVVGSEALHQVLEELQQTVLTFEETTDPTDPETIDEMQRLYTTLYQALEDAQAATASARAATQTATDAGGAAAAAAASANSAATLAGNAAATANRAAVTAGEKAQLANTAAQGAQAIIDGSKGTYGSLNERLNAIETSTEYEENNDPMSLYDSEA